MDCSQYIGTHAAQADHGHGAASARCSCSRISPA
uniref:Uncharacterized protein n=1 Tax=Arundo donax TaxID=35708 RepID=A0A0A9CYY2_ARUDO